MTTTTRQENTMFHLNQRATTAFNYLVNAGWWVDTGDVSPHHQDVLGRFHCRATKVTKWNEPTTPGGEPTPLDTVSFTRYSSDSDMTTDLNRLIVEVADSAMAYDLTAAEGPATHRRLTG
jgi:hypothetical protein